MDGNNGRSEQKRRKYGKLPRSLQKGNAPVAAYSLLKRFLQGVLPSFKDYYEKYGKIPENLTKGFACLMALYKITTKGDDGKYYAKLPSRIIETKDDEKYLAYFANGGCVIKFMQDESAWGEDLTKYEGFAAAVKTIVKKLRNGDTDIL